MRRSAATSTHHAGQATLSFNSGTGVTSLLLDVNGDAAADATIFLQGNQTGFHNFVL